MNKMLEAVRELRKEICMMSAEEIGYLYDDALSRCSGLISINSTKMIGSPYKKLSAVDNFGSELVDCNDNNIYMSCNRMKNPEINESDKQDAA